MTTIIGMLIGFCCVAAVFTRSGAGISVFFDAASIFCVIGGVVGATVMCYPATVLKNVVTGVAAAFSFGQTDRARDVETVVTVADTARKEGLMQLEDHISVIRDPFLRKGVRLLAEGNSAELIRSVLEADMITVREQRMSGHSALMQMSSFAPAFGIIGTIAGLVNLFRTMNNVTALGPSMAAALIPTLYGVLLASLIFTPLARRIKTMSEEEFIHKELMLAGIMSILNGENTAAIRAKLVAYLPTEPETPRKRRASSGGNRA